MPFLYSYSSVNGSILNAVLQIVQVTNLRGSEMACCSVFCVLSSVLVNFLEEYILWRCRVLAILCLVDKEFLSFDLNVICVIPDFCIFTNDYCLLKEIKEMTVMIVI